MFWTHSLYSSVVRLVPNSSSPVDVLGMIWWSWFSDCSWSGFFFFPFYDDLKSFFGLDSHIVWFLFFAWLEVSWFSSFLLWRWTTESLKISYFLHERLKTMRILFLPRLLNTPPIFFEKISNLISYFYKTHPRPVTSLVTEITPSSLDQVDLASPGGWATIKPGENAKRHHLTVISALLVQRQIGVLRRMGPSNGKVNFGYSIDWRVSTL